MEPTEVLTKALAAVEEAQIPDDLRELAFGKAVDLYAGTASPQTGGGQQHQAPPPPPPSERDRHSDLPERLTKVAEFYGLPADEVEDYFAEGEDGELRFTHDPESLGSTTVETVRSLSLLLGCARRMGGYDDNGTSVQVFRQECQRLGIYDTSNFSGHVGGMTKWFNVNGTGTGRTFVLKPTGRKDAKKLMSELAGT